MPAIVTIRRLACNLRPPLAVTGNGPAIELRALTRNHLRIATLTSSNRHAFTMFEVRYGSYVHDVGECEISHDIDLVLTDGQTPAKHSHRFTIDGMIVGSNSSAINAKSIQLALAYRKQAQDFIVRDLTTGATLTHLTLLSSDCQGGVRVTKPPSFPNNRGASGVTFLEYKIELQGDVLLVDTPTTLKSFSESIEYELGGPRFGWLKPNVGPPIMQQLRQSDTYKYTQSGSAVGLYQRPNPPAPLWPQYLMQARKGRIGSPRRFSDSYGDFEVTWSYPFESDVPLVGTPNVWGVTY
jgi:hypothetical protein